MQIIPLGVSLDCKRASGFAELDACIHSVHDLERAEEVGVVHSTALGLAFVLAVDLFPSGTDIAFIALDSEFVLVEFENNLFILILHHK